MGKKATKSDVPASPASEKKKEPAEKATKAEKAPLPAKDETKVIEKNESPAKASGSQSKEILEKVKKSFAAWVGKVDDLKGKSINDIYKLYLPILESTRKEFPDVSELDINKRAMRNFKLSFRQKSVGGRVRIKGIFIGKKGTIDAVKKRRADAFAKALINAKKAVKEGLIDGYIDKKTGKTIVKKDENGKYIPLDNRETYENYKDKSGNPVENKKFGKPLPKHSWSSTYLIMASIDDQEPELAFYVVRGDAAAPGVMNVPMDTPVTFYAFGADRVDQSTGLKIISGFKTKFEPCETDLPHLFQIFDSGALNKFLIPLSEMTDWFDTHKKDFNHFFVADVDLLQKSEEKSSNNTYRIIVADDSLGFAKEDGGNSYTSLNGFVPDEFEKKYREFGERSRLIIVGSCNRNWKKDSDGKTFVLDENNEKILDDPVLSIWGLDYDPELVEKPRETKEMPEEGDEDSDDDEEESEDDETDVEVADDDEPKKSTKMMKEVDAELDDSDDEKKTPKKAAKKSKTAKKSDDEESEDDSDGEEESDDESDEDEDSEDEEPEAEKKGSKTKKSEESEDDDEEESDDDEDSEDDDEESDEDT